MTLPTGLSSPTIPACPSPRSASLPAPLPDPHSAREYFAEVGHPQRDRPPDRDTAICMVVDMLRARGDHETATAVLKLRFEDQ